MKTIQKFTLGLLTVVATSSAAFSDPTTLILDVAGTDVSTFSGALTTTTAHKIGTGTINVDGTVTAALQLSAGQFNVSGSTSMPSAVTFDTTAGNILKINENTNAVHGLTMTASGELLLNTASLSWDTAPSGASILTIDGTAGAVKNLVLAADMSAAATPFDVQTQANLKVGGALHKATTGAHNIYGMLEILTSPAAGCVPGVTIIKTGGILKVDAGVTAYAHNDSLDLFGTGGSDTLTFETGATLTLGDGATWSRNITVGSAL